MAGNGMNRSIRMAVIGGGKKCRVLLEMLGAGVFPSFNAEVVAVADPDGDAAGMGLAKEKGIFTTADFRDLRKIPDLDLVLCLTGSEAPLEAVLKRRRPSERLLHAVISRLFEDILRVRQQYLLNELQLDITEGIIESLFLSMRDHVLLLRPDFRILDVNEAFCRACGTDKDSLVGKVCHEVIHGSGERCGGEGFVCPLKISLQTGTVAHAVHEHVDGSGKQRVCEVTTVPLRKVNGKVELVLEIVRDITEDLEKRVEEKTRALKRDLARLVHEDKMISLGKLVAGVVHEINNPLSGINALARLVHQELESCDLDEGRKKKFLYYLHLIDTESSRCSGIVKDLLSFSRLREVERKLFQLNDLVHKAVLLSRHRSGNQAVHFQLELAETLPEMIGDPGQLLQCLLNLIFNAVEAMPDGGTVKVGTRFDAARNQIRLEVTDQGIGIPAELTSKIFEPFFSTKNRDKGVGLGLSVVYGIVKEHGGTIYVRSELQKGTSFVVRLPLQSGKIWRSNRENG